MGAVVRAWQLTLAGVSVLGVMHGSVAASSAAADAPAPLFTAAQAAQGAALFAAKCAVCHGARLEGGAGLALTGTNFYRTAAERKLTVKSLFDVMTVTMPTTAPASLKREEYEALMAFVLQANGFQAGDQPLRKDAPGLDGVKLTRLTAAETAASRPASSGVYTAAQAAHGKVLYAEGCLTCHGGDLGGVEDSPAVAGRAFMMKWRGRTVGALHAVIDKTMPPGNGGALGAVGEADVVAYILSKNNYPPGNDTLPADPRSLSAIMLDTMP